MTPEEQEEQRRSWVDGELKMNESATIYQGDAMRLDDQTHEFAGTRPPTQYERNVEANAQELKSRPDILLQRSITSMESLRDRHLEKRISIEAEHDEKCRLIKEDFAEQKAFINSSINELEKQLSELRLRWSRVCDEEQSTIKAAIDGFEMQKSALEKMIAAQEAAIQTLRS